MFRPFVLVLSVCAALGMPNAAAQVRPLFLEEAVGEAPQEPPPLRLADSLKLGPQAQLRPAAEAAVADLAAMEAYNRKGLLPTQNGFARRLPEPVSFSLEDASAGVVAKSASGSTVWGTRVHVAGADRLRLHLTRADLPAGTRMWVWGRSGEPRAFGLELRGPEGGLWTPSVAGDELYLELELPPGASRAEVRATEIMELFDGARFKAGECVLNAACFGEDVLPQVEALRKAVAYLEFVTHQGVSASCTGSLLNDTDEGSLIPYLLTANHCFATATEAAAVEAFWDYRSAECGGPPPGFDVLPRSQGAILLATGAATDFTLVRLNGIPAGRFLLGWSADPVAPGTRLYRISHPAPFLLPLWQSFSTTIATAGGPACADRQRPNFLYSTPELGGTFGGSSGAPLVLAGGIVVGQLWGSCGPNPQDGCDVGNNEVDGAFAATFPFIAQFLAPNGSGDPAPPPSPWLTTPELPGFRLKARISNTRIATQVDDCAPETLCLAGAMPNRAEIFVRIIGPRPNGFRWPQVVRFTMARVEVWIQEGTTGPTNYYLLPGVSQDSDALNGLVDRQGFVP